MVPYAKRMEKMAFTANVVKGLFGSMTNPDIISFSGGSPAREALPVDTIRQLADEVLRTDTRGVEALQYGPIEGIRDLREVVVREGLCERQARALLQLPQERQAEAAAHLAWTTS